MSDRTGLWAGLAAVGLLTVCCGGPLLIGAISASVLLGWATHAFIPVTGLLVVVAGLAVYLRSRRARAGSECCDDRTGTPLRNLE